MTKEQVQERLDNLIKERENVRNALLAYEGAIQDCNFWLQELNKPVAEKAPKGK